VGRTSEAGLKPNAQREHFFDKKQRANGHDGIDYEDDFADPE